MTKFHRSKEGLPAICKAKIKCRLSSEHFDSFEAAQNYCDRINEFIESSSYEENTAINLFMQKELYSQKKENREYYSMSEALERGLLVEELTKQALNNNQSSDKLYQDPYTGAWSPERKELHDKLINKLKAKFSDVPNEGKVLVSGGIAGAGKTTVLYNHIDEDVNNYAFVSSDDFKELLAEENAIPKIDGLTQMECSTLVHNESSFLADRLMLEMSKEKKNLVYDFTFKDENSATRRINTLKNLGYSEKDIQIVFVHIPIETSKERAKRRYQDGLNKFKEGGRFLPDKISESQRANNVYTTKNAEAVLSYYDKNKNIPKPLIFDNSGIGPIQIEFEEFKSWEQK